jgi:hypothetical protein
MFSSISDDRQSAGTAERCASAVVLTEAIPVETSPEIRGFQAFAAYDGLRLRTYRERESVHARIRIEQVHGASLHRFDDVGYFNRVYAPTESIAWHLDEVEELYRGSPFGCELVVAHGDDDALPRACFLRGWSPGNSYAWLHMGAPLADTGPEYPEISIRQPRWDERTAFLEFYLRGFEAPAANFPAAIRNMRHLFDLPELHFLIGSCGGKPAAIGMLCVFGETGLLAAGATLPGQRRHGCHHALLAARIRLARELGCTDIVSYASTGGQSQRNMEQIGLRTVNVTRAWRFQGTGRG